MRARLLKPGFFTNEELAELPPMARLLFAGLWCLADREGRLEDRPKRIEAEVFPYDHLDVTPLLDELVAKKFIVRYEVDGKRLLFLPTFLSHQRPHPHEASSILPPCNDMSLQCHDKVGQCQAVPIAVPIAVPKTVIDPVGVMTCHGEVAVTSSPPTKHAPYERFWTLPMEALAMKAENSNRTNRRLIVTTLRWRRRFPGSIQCS